VIDGTHVYCMSFRSQLQTVPRELHHQPSRQDRRVNNHHFQVWVSQSLGHVNFVLNADLAQGSPNLGQHLVRT
jgi:hypothetical protein